MAIADLFPVADGILTLSPANKTDLLEQLATEAATRLHWPREDILDALQSRENLGSTALGRGIAMPHTRMKGLSMPLAILARLARPIDFDARDGEPVDLAFMVLWPEDASEGFLPALSNICRVLRDQHLPKQLRQAKSASEALAILQAADRADSPTEEP